MSFFVSPKIFGIVAFKLALAAIQWGAFVASPPFGFPTNVIVMLLFMSFNVTLSAGCELALITMKRFLTVMYHLVSF